ncbi:MAG: prepilin-type N-terminal cleavage/methylation domain-containing protein [Planctomycetota bacterium]
MPHASPARRPSGFTLIELLVVIGVIALLIGILLPVLGKARASGRAIASASNLRQWGTGMALFANDNNDLIPWDGEDQPGLSAGTPFRPTYEWDEWYANAIPPYLGYRRFREFLPNDGTPDGNSIFVDPAAETPENYPANYTISVNGQDRSYFFTYVINSALPRSVNAPPLFVVHKEPRVIDGFERPSLVDFSSASSTVLMIEKRAVRNEIADEKLGGTDSEFYSADLNRVKGDFQRFAARHNDGGHLLFADGHVEFTDYLDAITQADGSLDVENRGILQGGVGATRMNREDRIWAPYIWPYRFP